MVDIQRILCPIDFSDASRHALEHAAASARWYGAQITVIHVPLPLGAAGMSDEVAVLPPLFNPRTSSKPSAASARQSSSMVHSRLS